MVPVFRVGISGHQGLTASTELAVRRSIAEYLKSRSVCVGMTSLAEGADQIFAEEVIISGGELEVIVPSLGYEDSFESKPARAKFSQLRALSKVVIQLDYSEPSEDAYWAAGRKIAEECDELLAVWDGQESLGLGGTGDVVKYADQIGKPVVIIWPTGAARR